MIKTVSALAGALLVVGNLSGCVVVRDRQHDRRDWRDGQRDSRDQRRDERDDRGDRSGEWHGPGERHCWNENGRWVCRD